jgi:hypothetical protein
MDWWTHYNIVLIIVLFSILIGVSVAYREFAKKQRGK